MKEQDSRQQYHMNKSQILYDKYVIYAAFINNWSTWGEFMMYEIMLCDHIYWEPVKTWKVYTLIDFKCI